MGVYEQTVPRSMVDLMDALIKYPHERSCELLNVLPLGTLVDSGSGANISLGKYVTYERHAGYIALDNGKSKLGGGEPIDTATLLSRRLCGAHIPAAVFNLDVRSPDGCQYTVAGADKPIVVHQRFVLMHMQPEDRITALKQLAKIGTTIVLMEYSWLPMSSTTHPDIIATFKDKTIELMGYAHVNPFMGDQLRDLVEQVFPGKAKYQAFARNEDRYPLELRALVQMEHDIATAMMNIDLADYFGHLLKTLAEDEWRWADMQFFPASITAATIRLG